MGGYYFAKRETSSSSYVGVNTTLRLPISLHSNMLYNEANGISTSKNALPEFYIGLSAGSNANINYDAGVMCIGNNQFRWFLGASWGWLGSGALNASGGDIIYLDTEVYADNGAIYGRPVQWFLRFSIKKNGNYIMYNTFQITASCAALVNGSKAYRAIVVAANGNATFGVPESSCHFSETQFSGTAMKGTSGSAIVMSSANTAPLISGSDPHGLQWPAPPQGSYGLTQSGSLVDKVHASYSF